MALNKLSVNSLGAIISVGVLAVSGFLIIQPLNASTETNTQNLNQAKTLTISKTAKLKKLEAGVSDFEQAKADTIRFLEQATSTKDIESASRSISKSLTKGVKLTSFQFGEPEAVDVLPEPTASLSGYTTPIQFGGKAPAKAKGADGAAAPTASAKGFQRVPVQVVVTAKSYNDLSKFLDSIADQKRLLSVVAVDSSKGSFEGEVKATVSAYAFVYAK